MSISDRHSLPIAGIPMRGFVPATVTVHVEADGGPGKAAQHTAWMLCNLLCRLDGVVEELHFNIDERVELLPAVIPSGRPGSEFREELVRCINNFGLTRITDGDGGVKVFAGPGPSEGMRALGSGWVGGFWTASSSCVSSSPLPFGPYIAACYAAAEIFRSIALINYVPTDAAFYDAWAARPGPSGSGDGPPNLEMSLPSLSLAGVGAVGSAFLKTIWATEGVTGEIQAADPDIDGVDISNLNRYCLFGQSDLGRLKPSQAASILSRRGLRIMPLEAPFESVAHDQNIVICAVDENRARAAVQNSYRPTMLMASTYGLRAEVIRCANPGKTACLRCYNPPDDPMSDEEVRRAVEKLSEKQRAVLAENSGVKVADVAGFMEAEHCGETSDAILATMKVRLNQPARRFAIGFISVLAGVIVAAEAIKSQLQCQQPLDTGANRLSLQLVRPQTNSGASPYARDPSCPACAASPALEIWRERHRLLSNRIG